MSDAGPAAAVSPEPFACEAADGVPIRGFAWRGAACGQARPVVVINPATSVRCRYYARFAAFLAAHGFDAVTYDYRGIGESRPARLRGFAASWRDWGMLDCEAVLGHVARSFPGQPVDAVAHSIGGVLLGLAPSAHRLRRVVTMGAQYAYWRDYAPSSRLRMLAKWHVAMPLLTLAPGYFPGGRIGWLEDTPRGVVRDWARSRARLEDRWGGRSGEPSGDSDALRRAFLGVTAPILAISTTDDPFGTVAAVARTLAYFGGSRRTHLRIAPAEIGEQAIGHFAFFNSRFAGSLWPVPLAWLASGQLPPGHPGRVVAASPPSA